MAKPLRKTAAYFRYYQSIEHSDITVLLTKPNIVIVAVVLCRHSVGTAQPSTPHL